MSRLVLFTAALVACNSEAPIVDVDVTDEMTFCDSLTCFDDDFCTDDLCQPDGTCLHVARNAFAACQTTAHCDDQNACTDDACRLDDCGLMRCENVGRDGCQQCNDQFGMICDDANPCTDDTCGEDGICDFTANSPHCDIDCRHAQATSADAAQWGGYQGFTSYFFGVAEAQNGINCDAGLCTCEAPLVLAAYGFGFPLRAPEGSWTCSVEACELHEATCSPMIAGVAYLTWGMMQYQSQFDQQGAAPFADTALPTDAGAPPNQTIDRFDVQGYCLSTRFEHLPGGYAGTLGSDGTVASFDVEMRTGLNYEVIAKLTACDGCEAFGVIDGQEILVGPEFGVVALDVATANGIAKARLFSRAERFIGDLTTPAGGFIGVLELERLPR